MNSGADAERGAAPRTALVLSGGGARGAYEAGVVRYLRGEFAEALGPQPRSDLLCGTSIGAVNACQLAPLADAPERQGEGPVQVWQSLRADLASHLLFDREYADELIALGWHDARAMKDQLLDFFASDTSTPAADARSA